MGKDEDSTIPIPFPNAIQHILSSSESENSRNLEIIPTTKKAFNVCNLIKVYFDWAFIVGVSPFRIVNKTTIKGARSNTDNLPYYVPKTNQLQRVFCAILHSLCIIRLLSEVRYNYHGQNLDENVIKPTYYFRCTLSGLIMTFKCVTFKRFWINKMDFIDILNFIDVNKKRLPMKSFKYLNKWFLYTCCGVYVILAISGLPAGKHFVVPIQKWTPSYWYSQLISTAKYAFFVGERPDLTSPQMPFISFTFLDHVLAIVWSFTMLIRYMIGFFGDLCLLTMALTLWTTAYSFEQNVQSEIASFTQLPTSACWTIKSDSENVQIPVDINYEKNFTDKCQNSYRSWSNLYDQYKSIHELARLINKAMGSLMTCYLGESIMYYSVNCNQFIVTSDIHVRINLLFFYVNIITIFLLSADICHRMESMRQWLDQYANSTSNIPLIEVYLVLHGLSEKTVGIQGSQRFTITYGLIANFATLIITYFIICVEYSQRH